ncbi:MAG: hypothetical protein A2Z34_00650 [Planctomycetes bacterium RBG_16_59_8]|nr:MAG: hypothetical protein A2Z34_00650 [Planctomycetes bacterium RBG_16_59_8]
MDNKPLSGAEAKLSGLWQGFYTYIGYSSHCEMVADLTFRNGRVTGSGTDRNGWFIITGRYSDAAGDCLMTKTYPEYHDVFYKGHISNDEIMGAWWIPLGRVPGTFRLHRTGTSEGGARPIGEAVVPASSEPSLESPDNPEDTSGY